MKKNESLLYTLVKRFQSGAQTDTPPDATQQPLAEEAAPLPDAEQTSTSKEEEEQMPPQEELHSEEEEAIPMQSDLVLHTFMEEFCIAMDLPTAYNPLPDDADAAAFAQTLEKVALQYLQEKLQCEEPVDATAYLHISEDLCRGYVCVFPPLHGGREFFPIHMKATLEEAEISYGIQQATLKEIATQKNYCCIHLFAEGMLPEQGTPGHIEHHLEVSTKPKYTITENGTVDFKNLDLTNNIYTNEVICTITPPGEGIAGIGITGAELPAEMGKMPPIPQGSNTHLSEDGLELLASIDGNLTFTNGQYAVSTQFKINSDVDASVGNVSFAGDIYVQGNVKSGFLLEAAGDIFIKGLVEKATLIAGGNIIIQEGVNGDGDGHIEAVGDVTCTYVEHCDVVCGGSLRSECLINCTVYCDDSILVTKGKGTIIGGNIHAYNTIEAKIIGSKLNRPTNFQLGKSRSLVLKLEELKTQLLDIEETLLKLDKNLNYLEHVSERTPKQALLFDTLTTQKELYQSERAKHLQKQQELLKTARSYSQCILKAQMIYPPTKIHIGPIGHFISTLTSRISIRLSEEGEIQCGTH